MQHSQGEFLKRIRKFEKLWNYGLKRGVSLFSEKDEKDEQIMKQVLF